jgi:hypothetical protein
MLRTTAPQICAEPHHNKWSSSMKKANRTIIGIIASTGHELHDEQLRLVAGGMPRSTTRQTIPASYTEPGKKDTATDCEYD